MTRADALKIWLPVIKMGVESMQECNEALDMAIEALQQEPCDDATLKDIFCMGCEYREQEPCDAVSRKEVMNMLHNHAFDYATNTKISALLKTMRGEVDRMSSVTSAEKVGRWISIGDFECYCSNCHHWCYKRNKTRYCPSCGWKMQEVQSE